jgi:hypothetical protein
MASVSLIASVSAESVQASILADRLADVDEEEAAVAGNATMMTNQVAGGNKTGGTNSTN